MRRAQSAVLFPRGDDSANPDKSNPVSSSNYALCILKRYACALMRYYLNSSAKQQKTKEQKNKNKKENQLYTRV